MSLFISQAEEFEEIATMEFPFEGIPTVPPRKDFDRMVSKQWAQAVGNDFIQQVLPFASLSSQRVIGAIPKKQNGKLVYDMVYLGNDYALSR